MNSNMYCKKKPFSVEQGYEKYHYGNKMEGRKGCMTNGWSNQVKVEGQNQKTGSSTDSVNWPKP